MSGNRFTIHVRSCCSLVRSCLANKYCSAATAAAPQHVISDSSQAQWTPSSRRVGAIALKLGMSHLWLRDGNRVAVTLLQIVDNQVISVKEGDKEGLYNLEVGCVNHDRPHRLRESQLEYFEAAGVTPKRKLMEFPVTEDALLPIGTPLVAAHFMAGQYVDVRAITIGKGFQGVMKRHGMKGQPKSHGQTKTHRKMGATGGGGDPGRIFKGKRMPGRMGCKNATNFSVKVYRINHVFNVLYVKGQVPGHDNQYIRLRDGLWKPHSPERPPPFPTFIPSGHELPEEEFSNDIQLPHESVLQFEGKPMIKPPQRKR